MALFGAAACSRASLGSVASRSEIPATFHFSLFAVQILPAHHHDSGRRAFNVTRLAGYDDSFRSRHVRSDPKQALYCW